MIKQLLALSVLSWSCSRATASEARPYDAGPFSLTTMMVETRLLVECLPAEPRKHEIVYLAQLSDGGKLRCWPEDKADGGH